MRNKQKYTKVGRKFKQFYATNEWIIVRNLLIKGYFALENEKD